MYLLTKEKDKIESGTFASIDDDGNPIVQFFVNKDDAVTYATMLEAIGQEICVTEIEAEMLDKFCGALGHAYSIADEGEIVIPRIETLQHALVDFFDDSFQNPHF